VESIPLNALAQGVPYQQTTTDSVRLVDFGASIVVVFEASSTSQPATLA